MDTDTTIYLDQERYKAYLDSIEKAEKSLLDIQRKKTEFVTEYGSDSYANPELHQLSVSEQMAFKTLVDLKEKLSRIKIVASSDIAKTISLGSFVTLCIDMGDIHDTITFRLVPHSPNSLDEVSIESPIGAAVMNKRVHDTVSYKVGTNTIQATILEIK